jgi:hypothetical protein
MDSDRESLLESLKCIGILAQYPVWEMYIPLRGLPCDVRWRKVLDIAIDEVSGAMSMHAVPPAIQTIVSPIGVMVLLGLCNPPCS